MDLLVCQTLSDGLDTLAKRHTIHGNTVTVREHTGKNGASGRTADWLAGISILITNSLLGQPFRFGVIIRLSTITAKHIFSCGVRQQKNHLFSFFNSYPNLLVWFCFSVHCYPPLYLNDIFSSRKCLLHVLAFSVILISYGT